MDLNNIRAIRFIRVIRVKIPEFFSPGYRQ
jgi:hypothetical protein